jgi:hypothetical protein
LLVLAAVAVWFLLKPAEKAPAKADFGPSIVAAMADYKANNASTDSAPQQQVVNGWVAKDLLEVIARQQNAALSPASAPRDERVPAYLLMAVMGLGLIGGTSERPRVAQGLVPAAPVA